MKKLILKLIVNTVYAILCTMDRFYAVAINSWTQLHFKVRRFIAGIGVFFMKTIDPEHLESIERSQEAAHQNLELRLLNAVTEIRDHAKANGNWTQDHSNGIEAIGNTLLQQFGWEEEAVHQYMRQVVESIEGLEYDLE